MLAYKSNKLFFDNHSIESLAASYNTPLYVYSQSVIESNILKYKNAFGEFSPIICYAVKALSNINILKVISGLGCGFDCVSEGEMRRIMQFSSNLKHSVISGIGKSEEEISFALENDILLINIESIEEAFRINDIAKKMGKKAPIGIRFNPDIDGKTHSKIRTGTKEDKFGISQEDILLNIKTLAEQEYLEINAISCHIGSQITELKPYIDAYKRIQSLLDNLLAQGLKLEYLDIGGGVGIQYKDENLLSLDDMAAAYKEHLAKYNLKLIIEPGRSIVGNAGILISKIIEIKNQDSDKPFIIIDAGMNDIMRTALYDMYHQIKPADTSEAKKVTYQIVGPICESSDIHSKNELMPKQKNGQFLVILDSGAYCASMSSNYNTRPLASEILITNEQTKIIRKRQNYNDLFKNELL